MLAKAVYARKGGVCSQRRCMFAKAVYARKCGVCSQKWCMLAKVVYARKGGAWIISTHVIHKQCSQCLRESTRKYAWMKHTQLSLFDRFASVLSILGTQNPKQVRAMGVTLLPDGLFGKVVQLIFTPPEAAIKLCISDCDHGMLISAVLIGTNVMSFRPAHLSLQDLETINSVRKVVSAAISGKHSEYSGDVIKAIVQKLMQVLTCAKQGHCHVQREKQHSLYKYLWHKFTPVWTYFQVLLRNAGSDSSQKQSGESAQARWVEATTVTTGFEYLQQIRMPELQSSGHDGEKMTNVEL